MHNIAVSHSAIEKYFFTFITQLNYQGMSLSSYRRRRAAGMFVKDIMINCLEGDIVETGTFTGGTTAVMMKMLLDFDRCNRTLYAFDSFEGLPDRDPKDMIGQAGKGKKGYFSVTYEKYVENMKAVGVYNETILKTTKGWFKDTVPKCPVEKIAFLRMDGDMYVSTKDVVRTNDIRTLSLVVFSYYR
jgi:Macrocin-O-methyltransferase (TylF)